MRAPNTTTEPRRVLHVSARREDGGGIQSGLRHHLENDEAATGLAPAFISLFEKTATWPGECVSLGLHGRMTMAAARRAFARAASRWPGSLVVHHDAWGLEWFASEDRAARRIVFLHTERPHADRLVRAFIPRADGFLAVSNALLDRVRRLEPAFSEERLSVPPYFLERPEWLVGAATRAEETGRPFVIGYAGRVEREHKRMDRLPALLAELDRRGVDHRFEVLGDGALRPELERRLAGNKRVTFLGWRRGAEYWRTIAEWDCVLLLSDYEGFSRVTMEAMSCRALPVHPEYSAAAAEVLGDLAERGLYPVGDVTAAAARVAAYVALTEAERRRCREMAERRFARHDPANYDREFGVFLNKIAELPPRARTPKPPRWTQYLPLGVVTRLCPRRF